MTLRQPTLKSQAALLRKTFAAKGQTLGQGEALELTALLNGYPSWNVAKQQPSTPKSTPAATAAMDFKLWTALHHHRHGEDLYFFRKEPTEADVIERIEAVSSWEPQDHEFIELLGVESFDISVDVATVQAAQPPAATLASIYEVNMLELFEYETPDEVPEWSWVQAMAAFHHRGNGTDGGVWEFMVHADKVRLHLSSAPERLRAHLDKALGHNPAWLMFYQG